MQYDVFISSKSEDYHLAEEVYDFLTKNGLSAFIASEELQKIGEAQYANAIDEALDESVHMVVIASSLKHINSKWVKYEWSTFSNDLKSGFREGNLLTVLSGSIELKTLPASLRHQQSFHFDTYKKGILDYLKISLKKDKDEPSIQKQTDSSTCIAVFKFYSNESCQIMLEGKVVGNLEGMSDEPYYLPVSRKGDYRFKVVNLITTESKIIKEHIDADEEKEIEIEWGQYKTYNPNNNSLNMGSEDSDVLKKAFDVLGYTFNMIRVTKGSFYMGMADIPNSHLVILSKDFYIAETPVTQGFWDVIMRENPSRFMDSDHNRPVDSVSWDDCQTFIWRLNQLTGMNFRLPSEAEWEYAARGGAKSQNHLYSGSDVIDEVAWFLDNSCDQTHPVKQKKPNELGIYDMSGNVWEWCQDFYDDYEVGVQRDPTGPSKGLHHVYRGGCWCEDKDCMVTARRAGTSSFKSYGGLGLRLALSF
jgi:formylglycine-generating enzyme required for sulfatase activity